MLTPSEIDLLRQDLKSALEVVGRDEIEDAYALLHERGFRGEDFEIFQQTDPSPLYPGPIAGMVVVACKSNGTAKRYDAGSGSLWLTQFETDLKLHTFGRPQRESHAVVQTRVP